MFLRMNALILGYELCVYFYFLIFFLAFSKQVLVLRKTLPVLLASISWPITTAHECRAHLQLIVCHYAYVL